MMDTALMTDDTAFDPATNPMAFRHALGRFATGVTVITAQGPEGPAGITANSFASVSLDPPLVLWSPAKSAGRFPIFAEAPHYAIHVLSEAQRDIAAAFTRHVNAFDGLTWHTDANGTPIIENCLATFQCTRQATHDAGDHVIIVGRVTDVRTSEGSGLVFHGGRYGGFRDEG